MTAEDDVRRIVSGAEQFAADMKSKGIHVGMGRYPVCVSCGESWPCPTASADELTREAENLGLYDDDRR